MPLVNKGQDEATGLGGLDKEKATLTARVNELRDEKEQDYFVYDGDKFDSDPSSAQRIALAAQSASAAVSAGVEQPYPWTLYDNSVRVLAAAELQLVVNALAFWGGVVHTHASALKDAINTAGTFEALRAVDIEGGWPTPETVASAG